jgi:hypothetical protein
MREGFDVELLATVLEYAAAKGDQERLTDVMCLRAVSRAWKAAAATVLQRWIEQQIAERAQWPSLFPGVSMFSAFLICSEKLFRCLKLCAEDLSDSFFESVKTICLHSSTNASLSWVTERFPHLTGLTVGADKIGEPSVELLSSVGKHCPQLSAVGFGDCCRWEEHEVMAVLSSVPNLKSLSLTIPYGCSDGIFAYLQRRNYKLEFLDLSNFQLHYQRNLVAFLETQNQLRRINLSYVSNIGDRTLRTIGAVCKYLEHLALTTPNRCTETGLLAVLDGCPNLKRLKCPNWDNQALSVLPDRCPSIADLDLMIDLQKVSAESLCAFARCRELRALILHVTDFSAIEGAGSSDALWGSLGSLRKVEELTLRDANLSSAGFQSLGKGFGSTLKSLSLDRATRVSELALIEFLETSPVMTSIVLATVSNITDNLFEALARLPNVWHTVHVECEDRSSLSTEALAAFLLSPAAQKLNSLTIDGSDAVNDTLMECLASAPCSKSLECLSICCSCVTDDGLMQLVVHCPQLGLLSLSTDMDSELITDTFIDFLIETPHVLYYIDCCGVSGVSSRAVGAFARRYPDATICSSFSDEELGITKPNSRPAHSPPSLPNYSE